MSPHTATQRPSTDDEGQPVAPPARPLRCGLCERPVASFTFTLFGFQVEERACSPCGWHALLVDGAVTSMDDLLTRAHAAKHRAPTHR